MNKIIKQFKYSYYRLLCNISFGNYKKLCYQKKQKYKFKLHPELAPLPDNLSYEFNRKKGLGVRYNYNFDTEVNSLLSFQILNKMKEIDLKRKISEGKKAKVCFLIDGIAKQSIIPIYEQMLENELFDPFIVVYYENDGNFELPQYDYLWDEYLDSVKYFQNKNYKTYAGYDENRNIIPLETFKPDIVFTSASYLDYANTYLTNIFNNINYLVCYMNYGFDIANNYDYHYNNKNIASCWKYFVNTREDYLELIKFSKYYGSNAILAGYPKMDKYTLPIDDSNIPQKINNGKPIIIYAPHWTIRWEIEAVNLSTYHLYYDYFFNLAKNNPQYNFVFKPHPNLMYLVQDKKIMSLDEYKNYLEKWNNLSNGIVVTGGDYIDLFKKSDLMITDCGSFIGEWLLTEKPCIYLVNPERNLHTYMDGFSNFARKILEKYYLAYNQNDIEKYFQMVMESKQDPLKQERISVKDDIFINIGSASKNVVDYLKKVLID